MYETCIYSQTELSWLHRGVRTPNASESEFPRNGLHATSHQASVAENHSTLEAYNRSVCRPLG